MALRKRSAFVYPGTHKSGVGALVADDGVLKSVAVGSVENYLVGPYLEAFKPDDMVVTTTRIFDKKNCKVPVPSSIKEFRFASSQWESRPANINLEDSRKLGVYVHNVWRLLFHEGIRLSDIKIRDFKIEVLDRDWVVANGPTRIQHGH